MYINSNIPLTVTDKDMLPVLVTIILNGTVFKGIIPHIIIDD